MQACLSLPYHSSCFSLSIHAEDMVPASKSSFDPRLNGLILNLASPHSHPDIYQWSNRNLISLFTRSQPPTRIKGVAPAQVSYNLQSHITRTLTLGLVVQGWLASLNRIPSLPRDATQCSYFLLHFISYFTGSVRMGV